MWISKSEYNRLIEENTLLNKKVREQGLRISNLLTAVDDLNIKLYTINDRCYDVTLHLKADKTIKYTVNAKNAREASDIVIEQYEKDNLNYSKSDISFIRIDEI